MPVSENRFDDSDFHCKKCNRLLGRTVADGQALIVDGSNVGLWNFAMICCLECNKSQRWVAPHLRALEQSGDIDSVDDLPPVPKNIRVTRSGFGFVSHVK